MCITLLCFKFSSWTWTRCSCAPAFLNCGSIFISFLRGKTEWNINWINRILSCSWDFSANIESKVPLVLRSSCLVSFIMSCYAVCNDVYWGFCSETLLNANIPWMGTAFSFHSETSESNVSLLSFWCCEGLMLLDCWIYSCICGWILFTYFWSSMDNWHRLCEVSGCLLSGKSYNALNYITLIQLYSWEDSEIPTVTHPKLLLVGFWRLRVHFRGIIPNGQQNELCVIETRFASDANVISG